MGAIGDVSVTAPVRPGFRAGLRRWLLPVYKPSRTRLAPPVWRSVLLRPAVFEVWFRVRAWWFLATRGLSLVTQRATFLWPVPGLPLAAESTWLSCYAGLGQRVTVRFPGQVAPLTVGREGQFGTAGQLQVRFGAEATEAVDLALGAWQTRVLCAEGARAIGGPVTARRTGGEDGPFAVENRSALPLGRGLLWRIGTVEMATVPPVGPGDSATVPGLKGARPEGSAERYFGLPEPDPYDRHPSLLLLLRAGRAPPEIQADGSVHEPTTAVVYVAEVDPAALPGGGPTVAGESRLTDRVFVVVPVADGDDE